PSERHLLAIGFSPPGQSGPSQSGSQVTSNRQSLILDRLCDDAVEAKCIQKPRVWSLKECVSYASRLCSRDDLPTPQQLKSHLEARYGSTIQFLDRRIKSTLFYFGNAIKNYVVQRFQG